MRTLLEDSNSRTHTHYIMSLTSGATARDDVKSMLPIQCHMHFKFLISLILSSQKKKTERPYSKVFLLKPLRKYMLLQQCEHPIEIACVVYQHPKERL